MPEAQLFSRRLSLNLASALADDVNSRPRFRYGIGARPSAMGPLLGRLGDLEVRLAASAAAVQAAQALRYRVFYEEMSAVSEAATQWPKRDADRFDAICDHLVVLDRSSRGPSHQRGVEIVGTYRLLRQETAAKSHGFYSQAEFDLDPLFQRKPHLRFMELGRSCVLKRYRGRRAIELLWHGVWTYALWHEIDVMIGCASLQGTDHDRWSLALSFLHHHAACPPEWSVRAREARRVEMNRMPLDAIDARQALRALPPLLRAYLRFGAKVGDGAVIDRQFGTIDVCVVLPVAAISRRYINHYGPAAQRHAA